MYARPLVCSCLGAPVNGLVWSEFCFSSLLKNLFRLRQLFLFCSSALKVGEPALERFFFLWFFFFLIWCGLLFYNLSKCICVNAYSALVSLSMTISLKHLGVHYVHASTWMKMFSLKVEFLKIFLFMSKAVDLLLCNKSSTVEYILVRLHVLILTKSQAGGWELRCVA